MNGTAVEMDFIYSFLSFNGITVRSDFLHSTSGADMFADPQFYIPVRRSWEIAFGVAINILFLLIIGGGRVAKIVATAAAKHLTPVTLELGGMYICLSVTSN